MFRSYLPLIVTCVSGGVVRKGTLNPEARAAPFANSSLLIDNFNDTALNTLGFYHGVSGGSTFQDFDSKDGGRYLNVSTGDVDGK